VVYQNHEDENNSSEFFEASALLSKISRWISSLINHADGMPAASKSVKKNIFKAFQQSRKKK